MPGKKGEVRAMISDFGLCKKLKVINSKNSFVVFQFAKN